MAPGRKLRTRVAVRSADRVRYVARRFDPGLCAYTSHAHAFRERIAASVRELPGLYVTGDFMRGASIEACFHAARECAEAAMPRLS